MTSPDIRQQVIFTYYVCGLGVTVSAHRYFTHRSFKATRPMQVLLLTMFTCAGQNTVQQWVRDHRVHHKYSDTPADPHDANRGLFFSHIGWLMTRRNDEVRRRCKEMDISDIENDPMIQWHEKYFDILKLIACFIIPTMTGIWLWDASWRCAVAWQCFIRYLLVFHSELTVNSLAHAIGYRPYNKAILPAENWFVSIMTGGEGWHNYHHAFPYDYKTSEFVDIIQFSTNFIKFFHKIGWIYDLKEATPQMVESYAKRLG